MDNLFYFTDNSKYNKFKILELNYNLIISELPVFDINNVYLERNSTKWINDQSFDKIINEDLKNNDSWIRSSNTNNVWYTYPLIYKDKPVGRTEETCPLTIKLLQMLKGINICGFSLLLPNSKLPIHTDYTGPTYNSMALNMKLTGGICNLYIKNKNNKFIKYRHSVGKAVIFNSEVQHYADNNGSCNRIILYADVTN